MYEALLKATPEYQKIAASFAKPGPAALFGLPPAGRALLYAALQKDLDRVLCIVTPGEAEEIIIAGMGAETIIEILEAAPWVFDGRYNLVLVPATKHSILRRWLARRGFALRAETLCQAAGRWYAVMNAQYTGAPSEPDGLYCLTGLTQGQPGCADYYASQNAKLKKYRLGLPDGAETVSYTHLTLPTNSRV